MLLPERAELAAAVQAAHAAPQLFAQAKELWPAVEQEPAGFGELEVMGRPVEQLDAKLLLELSHLAAQCRLRDVQACGRAREFSLLRDRQEVLQSSAQVRHRHRITRRRSSRGRRVPELGTASR